MLWFSTRTTLGIDISDHVIRSVEVQHHRKTFVVKRFAEQVLPEGAIVRGDIQDPKAVHDALHQLLKHHSDTEHAAGVVSLPESRAFLKTIVIPTTATLDSEIARHLPFPLTDVSFDSLPHGMVEREGAAAQIVSFAAIPARITESYAKVMHDAHVRCRALEVESQALARLYVREQTDDVVTVLVDIGKTHATIIMITGGRIDVTHTSLDIHATAYQKLGTEIQRVIRFHREHGPIPDAKKAYTVLLTGGGSQIAGIVDTLHTELELPVAIAALPDVLELPPELRDASYSYNTAIGLGMRRFFPL